MSFSLTDLLDPIARRGHKEIGDVTSDDYADALSWAKSACRIAQRLDNWKCHKDDFAISSATTPALTEGVYKYDLRTLLTDIRKIDGDSIRVGDVPLRWKDEIAEIDRILGPGWKDAAAADSTPQLASHLGHNLILAPKVGATFAATKTVAGYYYKAESFADVDAALLFYDDFFEYIVEIALLHAMQQEDESEFRTQLQYWTGILTTEMRGFEYAESSDNQLDTPDWGIHIEGEDW